MKRSLPESFRPRFYPDGARETTNDPGPSEPGGDRREVSAADSIGLLHPDLDDLAGLDLMGVGLVMAPADRQQVLGDLDAEVLQGQVVEIVAEGVLDLDADLLDPEEGISHAERGQDREPAEGLDQGEGEREAVDDHHSAEV